MTSLDSHLERSRRECLNGVSSSHLNGQMFSPVVSNGRYSVIAVTGLGGHAFGSWKAKESDFMWLRDALAKDVSGLRILTYGFDSGLVGSTSFASIGSYAKELLRDLIGARSHVDVSVVAWSLSLYRMISRSQSP